MDIEWSLEIFCIHEDYLLSSNNHKIPKKYNHYFINCDCDCHKKVEECCYNSFYKNKNYFIVEKPKQRKKTPKNLFSKLNQNNTHDFLFNNNKKFNDNLFK